MAPYAVIITAKTMWHGKEEEFDFVFHYNTGSLPSEAGWVDLMNQVKNHMRPCYRSDTTFLRGRVHGPTNGTREDDVMVAATDFAAGSRDGTNTTGTSLPPELAVITELDLGRSARGYRQILKKYWRGSALASANTDQAQGRTALTSVNVAQQVTAYENLKTITVGVTPNSICNPAGKNLSSPPPAVRFVPYIHSRQLRRGRKRKRQVA